MGATRYILFISFSSLDSVPAADAGFEPYSALHGLVVCSFLALTACLVWLRRRWNGSPLAAKLDRVLAVGAISTWLAYKTFVLLPGERDTLYSLPIQFCDITGVIAPLALLTGRRPLRAVLYFWGVGLSTLAFITPDLHEGIGTGRFWLFWLSHSAIVGLALYDAAGRGFRPAWRDWTFAVVCAAIYVAIVAPFDALTHSNYGYVGPSRPGQPPILDALGPWPGRLPVQAALVMLEFFVLLLPWEISRRFSRCLADRAPSGNIVPTVTDRDGTVG